jgi:bifunctional ADP-heptose synthase (sugar kinase/adenylyltransferase)
VQLKNAGIIADSRRSLKGFPPLSFKMNRAEFNAFTSNSAPANLGALMETARRVAKVQERHVFVTLAEEGIVGASPAGEVEHRTALPVRGPIDIVGAGDAVTANLAAAFSAGAHLGEALELAMLAASCVVHQLGTTGTAAVDQLRELHAAAHDCSSS